MSTPALPTVGHWVDVRPRGKSRSSSFLVKRHWSTGLGFDARASLSRKIRSVDLELFEWKYSNDSCWSAPGSPS